MPVKKRRKRNSNFEARVRLIVARLIGEKVEEVVRQTIVEQLALRFGALPDARKARAVIRTFRPDWNRREEGKEMVKSKQENDEAKEAPACKDGAVKKDAHASAISLELVR